MYIILLYIYHLKNEMLAYDVVNVDIRLFKVKY